MLQNFTVYYNVTTPPPMPFDVPPAAAIFPTPPEGPHMQNGQFLSSAEALATGQGRTVSVSPHFQFQVTYDVNTPQQNAWASLIHQGIQQFCRESDLLCSYVRAAAEIPGLRISFCAHGKPLVHGNFAGEYDPLLRQILLHPAIFKDEAKLMEVLRHELFHAACHALQLFNNHFTFQSKNIKSNAAQPYLNPTQKEKLESFLILGKEKLDNYIKNLKQNYQTPQNKIFQTKMSLMKVPYTYEQTGPQSENKSNFVLGLKEADFITSGFFIERLKTVYTEDIILAERLAHLFGGVPYIIIENFFTEISNHMKHTFHQISWERLSSIHLSFIPENPGFYCKYPKLRNNINKILSDHYHIEYSPETRDVYFDYIDALFTTCFSGSPHPDEKTKIKKMLGDLFTEQKLVRSAANTNQQIRDDRLQAYLYLGALAYAEADDNEAIKNYDLALKELRNEQLPAKIRAVWSQQFMPKTHNDIYVEVLRFKKRFQDANHAQKRKYFDPAHN